MSTALQTLQTWSQGAYFAYDIAAAGYTPGDMRSSAVLVLLWAVLLSNACIADCAQQVAGSGNNAAKTKAVGDTKRQVRLVVLFEQNSAFA